MKLAERTNLVRNVAVALCAACAAAYVAIGLGLAFEGDGSRMPQWVFGFSSAASFALGVVLLLARPGRLVWGLGAAWMVVVIVLYFLIAPSRTPNYEIWGITLKIAQVVTLVALLGLLAADRRVRSRGSMATNS